MKITRIKFWKENLDLLVPYTIAFKTVTAVENLFVEITLENGIKGIGSGAPAPMITREKMEASMVALEAALPRLENRDIRHYLGLIKEMNNLLARFPAALTAVDIALHDAFTQWLGVPLATYLGQVHKKLPTSITIGIQSLEDTLKESKERLSQGFKILKLKTGQNVAEDIEKFSQLRATLGKEIKIRVDANQGYDNDSFLKFFKKVEHLDLEFFEQPFPARQLDTMRLLPPDIRKKCAADESLHSPADASRIIANQAFGIFNIKLMKCGGLINGQRIAEIAHDFGIEVMWGCMDESRVSITAALHLAFACPATKYLDLDGSIDLGRDVVSGGFELKDGTMVLTEKPGLGLERA